MLLMEMWADLLIGMIDLMSGELDIHNPNFKPCRIRTLAMATTQLPTDHEQHNMKLQI